MSKLNAKNASRQPGRVLDGPERLQRLLHTLDEDIAGLPLSADPPPEVVKAHKAYDAAAAWARSSLDKLEAAKTAETAAAADDVKKMKTSLRKGGASPKLTAVASAAEAAADALVRLQAAGQLLSEAHEVIVDAAFEAWPTWRRALIDDAAEAHAAAFVAAQQAAADVATARAVYGAVGSLDAEIRGRFPEIKAQVDAERHTGIPWYSATHDARPPLKTVTIPGVERNGKPRALDLAVVLDAVQQTVASAGAFAPADWTPPSDPDHDAVLATPLDLGAAWVRSAVGREHGTTCDICRQPHADTVVLDGSTLVLVHARCRDRKPDEKELKRAERLAKMQAQGFPPQPDQQPQGLAPGDLEREDEARAAETQSNAVGGTTP